MANKKWASTAGNFIKPGSLDLSRHGLDGDSQSWQLKNWQLDSRDFLDTLKWCLDMSRKCWHFKKLSHNTLDALKQCLSTGAPWLLSKGSATRQTESSIWNISVVFYYFVLFYLSSWSYEMNLLNVLWQCRSVETVLSIFLVV